jgi:hypothetical protein
MPFSGLVNGIDAPVFALRRRSFVRRIEMNQKRGWWNIQRFL